MRIGRTLFWFKDGDEQLILLNEDFYALGVLMNRLLNQHYNGKKIKFINIDFATDRTYELYPVIPKDMPYYYGGHLSYYGVFNKPEFDKLDRVEQGKFIWERAFQYLCKSAEHMKNPQLLEAAQYAFKKGIAINLNPDYRMVETSESISGQELIVAVWVNFRDDGVCSKLTIEKGEEVLFVKEIDKVKETIGYFLEIYKSIEVKDNSIIIKGDRDVDYLPLKIPFPHIVN
ncbi:hypothetical protein ECE50_015765 [Chitinophaga sp. Mgbs1]|uniref:Uncharacterized protein n=1 Tax=Chitinophaga solisilvae TaxID=1233460 RepID=A0A3S1D5V0_9BACT|nr:hypothetical protein [Chitinophaga solisilvae]